MALLGIEESEVYEYRRQKEVKLARYTRQMRAEDTSEKISIKTRVGFVDMYLYRPSIDPCALVFNFHGGGFVLGYWELDAPYCRVLADQSGACVVNVDYKVAPEYKFPLPFTTTYEAMRKLLARADAYDIADLRVVVGGSSAGASLSTGIIQLNNRSDEPFDIAGMYLNYPELKQQLEPRPAADETKAIATSRIEQYMSWLFNSSDEFTDPLASPLTSPCVAYPATLMNIAGLDSLCSEAKEFRDKLVTAGVPVDYRCFEGCMHGFTHRDLKEYDEIASKAAWSRIARFIQRVSSEGEGFL